MKTLITISLFFISILSLPAVANATEPLPNGFRKAVWGMTRDQVKATEEEKVKFEKDNILVYSGKVAGMEVDIAYIFADDKLVRAKYLFLVRHTNLNDHISDFESVKSALKEKYGVPKTDHIFWSNDLYKDDHEQWGMAISAGHLSYYATWEDEKTGITLGLTGDNFEITHAVEYLSIQLKHLEEEAKKKKEKSDF